MPHEIAPTELPRVTLIDILVCHMLTHFLQLVNLGKRWMMHEKDVFDVKSEKKLRKLHFFLFFLKFSVLNSPLNIVTFSVLFFLDYTLKTSIHRHKVQKNVFEAAWLYSCIFKTFSCVINTNSFDQELFSIFLCI